MTPAARLQAAIELLAAIEADERPADLVARRFLRARRYIGSKDRRAITDRLYAVLRAQFALDWRLTRHGAAPSARLWALIHSVLTEPDGLDGVAALCGSSQYAPPPLSEAETTLLGEIAAADHDDRAAMPAAARLGVPEWLKPALERRFGAAFEPEVAALVGEASLDLRVNERRADRDAMVAALCSLGLDAAPTPQSPIGIRVAGRPNVTGLDVYRDGLLEVQDEGAQLVALLVAAETARCVVDYCAGAGGKTLALEQRLAQGARLIACDTDADRLARMDPRRARADAANIETRVLGDADDSWLTEMAGAADRLLVDMPCSGTGTWRRAPDQPRRLTAERLNSYRAQQTAILEQAAPLVAPGGRLIYATCSVLGEENEDQVTAFLAAHVGFKTMPIETVWRETIGTEPPATGPWLQLTPHTHGTDGFFVAILERKQAAGQS